jgi:hypothetical protein
MEYLGVNEVALTESRYLKGWLYITSPYFFATLQQKSFAVMANSQLPNPFTIKSNAQMGLFSADSGEINH